MAYIARFIENFELEEIAPSGDDVKQPLLLGEPERTQCYFRIYGAVSNGGNGYG